MKLRCLLLLTLVPSAWGQSHKQDFVEETLSGPDAHESSAESRGYLFGGFGGRRARLLARGVHPDLQYLGDSLWNLRSVQKTRLRSFNRVRGTLDIDFSRLTETPGLTFHITAVWQGGSLIGPYLGLAAASSGIASGNTARLDSWWFEQRFAADHLIFRLGQFAAQDFYGSQHYASSYILEPLDYAFGNLTASVYASFDPPSTPAAELRAVPVDHVYIKSMVFAADRFPYAHNRSGLVPQFRGAASSASEIGWTPGQRASGVHSFDTVSSRKGYTGLYKFGGIFNPGKFASTRTGSTVSGNYLVYGAANQSVWRVCSQSAKGLDVTAGATYTPPDRSRIRQETTFGLRFNEPLPVHNHNTVSFGWVRSAFSPGPAPARAENAFELNALVDATPYLLLQPVVQRTISAGGLNRATTVFGFRSKVEF